MHLAEPVGEYEPAGHLKQLVDPSLAAKVPAGQERQLVGEEAPTVFEYVPTGHEVQGLAFVLAFSVL
jgi:hypothetical protein